MGAPNEIQIGRLNGLLHKLLSMKEGSPAPTLMPEISPGLTLESDRPEWEFLAGGHLAWGGALLTAGVGVRARIGLLNPAGSGALFVVSKVVVCPQNTAAVCYFTFRLVNNAGEVASFGSAGATQIWRDTRGITVRSNNAAQGIVGQIVTGTTATPLAVQALWVRGRDPDQNTIIVDFPEGIVLDPGTILAVTQELDNESFGASFVWRERTEEASELR